ncbi:hypothetical protein [Myxococcus sp. CA039A]|uniref:hypothetical protein n=1 Tax=Myxococcus sp. CA039A TaxID=2741737 RepID=UPI00157A7DF5|nr:hypothetical protein [Myxococcus sp. CA039A]NTX54829.1 hypothetical protein [Myxococcus sp. CA039A]
MSAPTKSHLWGNPDADGVRACKNQGCTIRVVDSFRAWQRKMGAHWRRQDRELIPECTGIGPVVTERATVADAEPDASVWRQYALDLSALVSMYNSVVQDLPERWQKPFGDAGVGIVAAHLRNAEPEVPLSDKSTAMERYCDVLRAHGRGKAVPS